MEPNAAAAQLIELAALMMAAAAFFAIPSGGRASKWRLSAARLRHVLDQVLRRGRSYERRKYDEETIRVIDFTIALAAELRGGQTPNEAWTRLWPSSGLAADLTSLDPRNDEFA